MKLLVGLLVTVFTFASIVAAQPAPPSPNSGFLGGKFAPVSDEIAEEMGLASTVGVFTMEIIDGSPAMKAGILEKDVIIKIDDKSIDDVEVFRDVMSATKPGQLMKFTIIREKAEKVIEITLGKRPATMPSTQPAMPK